MKSTALSTLSGQYLAALRIHFERGSQEGLQSAREVGRQALAAGVETLDLAKIHDHAVAALVLPGSTASRRAGMSTDAAFFFTEANTAIEKTHRIALEAGASLKVLNDTLAQQTLDLADSDRELKLHVAERKTTEAVLKASEQASTQLLKESYLVEKHLRDMTHKILAAEEEERSRMSLQLQDEIAQTLLGIHVRLLALKSEDMANHAGLTKEIAITQQMVDASVNIINQFARDFGIQHEK